MILVLPPHFDERRIEELTRECRRLQFHPTVSRGREQTVIALAGEGNVLALQSWTEEGTAVGEADPSGASTSSWQERQVSSSTSGAGACTRCSSWQARQVRPRRAAACGVPGAASNTSRWQPMQSRLTRASRSARSARW